MKLGIVGYGIVGQHLHRLFERAVKHIVVFDKHKPGYSNDEVKKAINDCELVFIAVPTPEASNGSCDLTEVNEAVAWITPAACIKSTVPPGTTERLSRQTGRALVFSPEYIGETLFHPSQSNTFAPVVAMGGDRQTALKFIGLYQRAVGPSAKYFIADAATVELAKYMENCFLATKVAFVAQFALLAEYFGADFIQMREIWVADPRIGLSHSTIVDGLGFSGKCLPKDLRAIIYEAGRAGGAPFLEAVDGFNRSVRSMADAKSQRQNAILTFEKTSE